MPMLIYSSPCTQLLAHVHFSSISSRAAHHSLGCMFLLRISFLFVFVLSSCCLLTLNAFVERDAYLFKTYP